MLFVSTGALVRASRGLLPIKPIAALVKLTVAPRVCMRLASVTSTELMPVPPGVSVILESPCARVRAPRVSTEAVWARP